MAQADPLGRVILGMESWRRRDGTVDYSKLVVIEIRELLGRRGFHCNVEEGIRFGSREITIAFRPDEEIH